MDKRYLVLMLAVLMVPALVCADATREEAEDSIKRAELDIQEMVKECLPTNSVNDTLSEAMHALERADFAALIMGNASGELAQKARKALEGMDYQRFTYDEVVKYADEIKLKKQKTYVLMDSVKALEIKLEDYKGQGINTSEAEKILENVKTSFGNERFTETENLLAEANLDLEDRKAESSTVSLAVKSGKNFIEGMWGEFLIIIFICIVIGIFGWRRLMIRRLQKKLEELKIENYSLKELMKKIQIQRFKEGSIPKSVYDIRMESYRKRLNKIEGMIPTLTENPGGGKHRPIVLLDFRKVKDLFNRPLKDKDTG